MIEINLHFDTEVKQLFLFSSERGSTAVNSLKLCSHFFPTAYLRFYAHIS